jgi:SAM-dependent methyltransferase
MKLGSRNRLGVVIRRLLHPVKARLMPSPADVVKANTRKAFEYFYSGEEFIATQYLEPARLAFYDVVAAFCVDIIRAMNERGVVRIVDIGCGTGHLLEALERKLGASQPLELFGLDFASAAVRRARVLLPEATFFIEDLYNNTLPSGFFDLVLSTETLEHLRTPERALKEFLRVCRPGGSAVVTVPNGAQDTWDGHVNYWRLQDFTTVLSPFGLADIRLIVNDKAILARLCR